MPDSSTLQADLLHLFDFAHHLDDWVTPMEDALTGVTAEEALWKPAPNSPGIWEIVLHMAAWTENAVERMRTGVHSRPRDGHWPPLPAVTDEAAWAAAQERLRSAVAGLKAEIAATSSAGLLERRIGSGELAWTPLLEIVGRFLHNAYHLGQITKLREFQGASGEPAAGSPP